jgi:hypothetical protein
LEADFQNNLSIFESTNLVLLKNYLEAVKKKMNEFINAMNKLPQILLDYNDIITKTLNYLYLYTYCNNTNTVIDSYNEDFIKNFPKVSPPV